MYPCLILFTDRGSTPGGRRLKKIQLEQRNGGWGLKKQHRESEILLTANLNNHLNVLTNGFKRDIWRLKIPSACLVVETCFQNWTNNWFWTQLVETKTLLKVWTRQNDFYTTNKTLLQFGSILAWMHFLSSECLLWDWFYQQHWSHQRLSQWYPMLSCLPLSIQDWNWGAEGDHPVILRCSTTAAHQCLQGTMGQMQRTNVAFVKLWHWDSNLLILFLCSCSGRNNWDGMRPQSTTWADELAHR